MENQKQLVMFFKYILMWEKIEKTVESRLDFFCVEIHVEIEESSRLPWNLMEKILLNTGKFT